MTSTWSYYGGFHVFGDSTESTSTGNPASTWFYYGGFHAFSHDLFLPTTSSGVAPTPSTGRIRGNSIVAFEVMAHRARRRSGRYVV